MQGSAEIDQLGEWKPYEAAPAESYLLKPPLQFFRLRWALMRFNPLTWHCPGQAYTAGEAILTLAILGEMIVMGYWWALVPSVRVNVAVTGAPLRHGRRSRRSRRTRHGSCSAPRGTVPVFLRH